MLLVWYKSKQLTSNLSSLYTTMIKKRSRPTTRVRELSPDEPEPQTEEGLNPIPCVTILHRVLKVSFFSISDLLEFRKFKKTKLGIDSNKLSKGDGRRSKRTDTDLGVESTGGLRRPEVVREDEDEFVSSTPHNFRHANALLVMMRRGPRPGEPSDPTISLARQMYWMSTNICSCLLLPSSSRAHIYRMAYIEENLRTRARPKGDEPTKPVDPDDELYAIADRWKVKKALPATENEGSVTNSMTMLTAIPEVDLGME